MPLATSKCFIRHIQMRHLMRSVHTGIRTTGHSQSQRLSLVTDRHTQHLVQRILDSSLHRAQLRLLGPAVESAAVIGKVDA